MVNPSNQPDEEKREALQRAYDLETLEYLISNADEQIVLDEMKEELFKILIQRTSEQILEKNESSLTPIPKSEEEEND